MPATEVQQHEQTEKQCDRYQKPDAGRITASQEYGLWGRGRGCVAHLRTSPSITCPFSPNSTIRMGPGAYGRGAFAG